MLSFLPIPWDSAFKWVYVSFSPLPFASFLFRAIYKAFSDNHFAFLHFFFEVRDSGRECQAAIAQEQPREATPHPRSGAVVGRTYPTPKARGCSQEEQPHVQGAVAARASEGRHTETIITEKLINLITLGPQPCLTQ